MVHLGLNSTNLTSQWWNDGTNLILRLERLLVANTKREENNLLSMSDVSGWVSSEKRGWLDRCSTLPSRNYLRIGTQIG